MSIIILLFTFSFFFLAQKKLNWALFLILLFLPAYQIRFKIFGIPSTLLEIMILSTFFAWFWGERKRVWQNFKNRIQAKKGLKFIAYPLSAEIILLLFVSFLAIAIANFDNRAFGIWKAYFFEPILFYILFLNVFKGLKNYQDKLFDYVIFPLSISAFFVSIFAIYQKITGKFIDNEFWANESTRRVVSVFDYPNALALFLAPLVVLFFVYLLFLFKQKKLYWQKLFLSATIFLSLFSIYFAKSEGALLALVIVFFLILFLWSRTGAFVASVLIASSIFFFLGFPALQTKLSDKIFLKDLSGEIRKQQWRETWQMLNSSWQKFFFGAGLSGYQNAVRPYHQEGIFFNKEKDPDFRRKIVIFNDKYRAEHWQPVEIYLYPHNFFLNFWTELGLLGMLLFAWLVLKISFLSLKNLKKNKLFLIPLAMIALVFIHGLVDVPYFKNDLSIIFWLILSIFALLRLSPNTDFA